MLFFAFWYPLAVALSRDWEFKGRQSYFVKADLSDAEEFKSEIVFLAAVLIKVYNETVAWSSHIALCYPVIIVLN